MTHTARDRIAILAAPLTGLTFVTGVFGAILVAEGTFPRPGSSDEAIRDYYETNPTSAAPSATMLDVQHTSRAGPSSQAARCTASVSG